MKTFTAKDYRRHFGAPLKSSGWFGADCQLEKGIKESYCRCVHDWDLSAPKKCKIPNNPSAYAYCKNCFGYGIFPIPWSEVKK